MITEKIRHNWQKVEIDHLFSMPFFDLLFLAHSTHRQYFPDNKIQLSTLLSIKTGACPEDCAYCPQSGHHETAYKKEALMSLANIKEKAIAAKESGATRFCMGAAWRNPPEKEFHKIINIIKEIKTLGLETCMTLGMLSKEQAQALQEAGLDYYNHNLDTSPEYYTQIISTRSYDDRLHTLQHVREAGMKVCCGGIVGMGETQDDRVSFLQQLANLPQHPESVPINRLVAVKGTPLADTPELGALDFVRTIAVARIMMPASKVRLSAGRETMSDETQALCFFAGANSIFYGEKLLVTSNPQACKDRDLLNRLGLAICETNIS
ncbi:MAG: biotin synthase BioB [Gammaproteobacteria bacterium]|nr:biotin synthase BioB [Gammaproteobacteria bacterium]